MRHSSHRTDRGVVSWNILMMCSCLPLRLVFHPLGSDLYWGKLPHVSATICQFKIKKGIFHSTPTWCHTRFNNLHTSISSSVPCQTQPFGQSTLRDSISFKHALSLRTCILFSKPCYLHAPHKNNFLHPSSRTPSCLQDRCMGLHCSICMCTAKLIYSKRVCPLIPSWLLYV